MIKKILIEYVRASREADVHEYFIRQALLDAGWDRNDVDNALDSEEAWPPAARVDFMDRISVPVKKRRSFNRQRIGLSAKQQIISIISTILILLAGFSAWGFIKYYDPLYEILLPSNEQGALSFRFGSWPALEDAEFFKEVKVNFIEGGASFIEGDLSEMKLRVYKGGSLKFEAPILSKGNEGSWWETPAGLYQVQDKQPDHFSSFGGVYMPWSMPFQGNFFIHGWPYYPGGNPVAPGYSGGCIRLGNEDAKRIYNLASSGMPVLIFEKDFEADDFEYELLEDQLSANAFLGADLRNNFVFAEKNSKDVVPIASLTKLMTALVATEYINVERNIVITSDMLVPTSKPRLKINQRVSVLDLLYPLLMESSNEAGVAIAHVLGTDRFVNLMNEKARAIGMKNTFFADTTGINAENASTVQDLFQLAKYLYNNRSFVLAISKGGVGKSAYDPPSWYDLRNFNVFSEDSNFVGGKVGMSNAAGETILSIFELEKANNKRPVVVIALGSKDRAKDALNLIEYIRRSY